ncbi:hypothetical protein BDV32DRAFT_127049, partial [Aspergillus pseudonomiae]
MHAETENGLSASHNLYSAAIVKIVIMESLGYKSLLILVLNITVINNTALLSVTQSSI